MGDKAKDQLVAEAQAAGVDDAEDLTKAELIERLEGHDTSAAGAYVPEGELEPVIEESNEKPAVGVQPLVGEDIPDAGR